jgi:DNA adenine methylase
MLKHLLPMIPQHTCYVEVFAGGLALLLAKERSRMEVANDLNGDLVGLYRVVQYHLPELEREMALMLCARENLKDYVAQKGLTDVQRAARFLVRFKISFGANGHSFAVARKPGGGAAFQRENLKRDLKAAHERLDGVAIENLPWERCVKNYDGTETFFFFDPPYICPEIDAYKSWTEADLRALAKTLNRLNGQWILTINDCPLARELFAGRTITEVTQQSGATKVATGKTMSELIIQSKPSNE